MAQQQRTARVKKPETSKVRKSDSSGRVRKGATKLAAPVVGFFKKVGEILSLEYHPIKLPDNKLGRFLTKRRSLVPGYFKGAWYEIKHTTWPNRRETWRLTFAVFVFAIVFSAIVSALDIVLDKIFRTIIIG